MKLSLETVGRLYAAGRNYASMAIGVAAGAGVLSAAQDKSLTDALNEMATGISMVVHGATSAYQVGVIVLGPMVGVVFAFYAQRSARTESQAKAVAAAVDDPHTPITPAAKNAIQTAAAKV